MIIRRLDSHNAYDIRITEEDLARDFVDVRQAVVRLLTPAGLDGQGRMRMMNFLNTEVEEPNIAEARQMARMMYRAALLEIGMPAKIPRPPKFYISDSIERIIDLPKVKQPWECDRVRYDENVRRSAFIQYCHLFFKAQKRHVEKMNTLEGASYRSGQFEGTKKPVYRLSRPSCSSTAQFMNRDKKGKLKIGLFSPAVLQCEEQSRGTRNECEDGGSSSVDEYTQRFPHQSALSPLRVIPEKRRSGCLGMSTTYRGTAQEELNSETTMRRHREEIEDELFARTMSSRLTASDNSIRIRNLLLSRECGRVFEALPNEIKQIMLKFLQTYGIIDRAIREWDAIEESDHFDFIGYTANQEDLSRDIQQLDTNRDGSTIAASGSVQSRTSVVDNLCRGIQSNVQTVTAEELLSFESRELLRAQQAVPTSPTDRTTWPQVIRRRFIPPIFPSMAIQFLAEYQPESYLPTSSMQDSFALRKKSKDVLESLSRGFGKNKTHFFQYGHSYNSHPSFNHEQLRQLVHSVSPSQVCFFPPPIAESKARILNTIDGTVKDFSISNSPWPAVTCLNANSEVVGGGTAAGLVKVMRIHDGRTLFNRQIFRQPEIVNWIDFHHPSGFGIIPSDLNMITAGNDCHVAEWNLEIDMKLWHIKFPWCVNHAIVSPTNKKLICVSGDTQDVLLVSREQRQLVSRLKGHSHHGFAASWHPSGLLVATGNQDHTCRVWDIRHTKAALIAIHSPVRSVEFSPDGAFLLFCEERRLAHIYEVASNFKSTQTLNLGSVSIAGCCFSPDSSKIWIGCPEALGLVEFIRGLPVPYLVVDPPNCFNSTARSLRSSPTAQPDVWVDEAEEIRGFVMDWLHNTPHF